MNNYETDVLSELRDAGYLVIRGGWPDFMIVDLENRPLALEIKRGADKLRPNQAMIHSILRQCGLPVALMVNNRVDEEGQRWGLLSQADVWENMFPGHKFSK